MRMETETRSEKWILYVATILAKTRNVGLEEAVALAKNEIAQADRHRNKERALKHKKRMAKLEPRRKFKAHYRTYGPPLQGGAPGLGKRK
jgi:hypothetical protein